MSSLQHCITADWPAPANIRTLMTTRAGGVSEGPYASMNLGRSVADQPERVEKNRALLQDLVGAPVRWLSQVHGTVAVYASNEMAGSKADAVWTDQPNLVCSVQVADCLPVMLASRDGSAVGIAHAGWRGLAAGVLESTIAAMRRDGSQLLAWLGPAIGPDAFEVGDEVRQAFLAQDTAAGAAFRARPNGKYLADLFSLARMRLASAGVTAVYGGGTCTFSNADRFYSFRREPKTGRMAALIWIETAPS